ncbi:1-acyl-sn-glycerol-3-phosphate acyltransferase [Synechococcus sp. AH-736-M02]|nr:1-acyl-sn-glycerol-3-phosphate acyltransferase [Synechococcus sp. AH-736-M02]
MPRASTQNARPALRRLPTHPSRMVQAVVSRLLPLLFRSQGLELSHRDAAEGLARAFAAQQSGACNLLIAFRHPSTRDPVVMADLFWNGIPRAARRLKLQLPRPIQLRFLYDRGIPIWAGPVIGWLLQRSGGIAIHRGRLDRPALAQARRALAQGRYPLVVAPEGATNNLSGEMAPLEPGVAQLAFWAAEDLEKANDERPLEVLPIGIHYSWRHPDWTALKARLACLERHLGISSPDAGPDNSETTSRDRLIQIGMKLLKALEQLERLKPDPAQTFSERIDAYRRHGLAKAETHFGVRAGGNLQERCRRIEQAAWDRIYREGVDQLPLPWRLRGLALIPSRAGCCLPFYPGRTWRKPWASTTLSGVLNSSLSSAGRSISRGLPSPTRRPFARNSTRSISGTIVSTRWVTCTTELALLLFNSL